MVAWADVRDVRANFRNNTGRLMPHHQRRNSSTGRAVQAVDIATANAACAHADQHVGGTDFRLREVGHFEFHVLF